MNLLFFVSHWLIQKSSNILLNKLLKMRNRHWLILDISIFATTPLLALILRLDGIPSLEAYLPNLAFATILFLLIKQFILWSSGFYRRYWRYASIEELTYIAMLMAAAIIIQSFCFDVIHSIPNSVFSGLPRSLPLIDGLLSFIFIGGLRFSIKAVERTNKKRAVFNPSQRVLIVGAGNAGVTLLQEMQTNPQQGFYPVAFVDDDPQKLYAHIRGVPVVGDRHKIPDIVKSLQIHKVIIAMPTVAGKVIREIVDICKATGIQTSTLPGIHEILNGRVRVDSIRDVRIEDLLRREPIQTDIGRVAEFLAGKRVLITGAGGSIGSELCRQIYKCHPAQMMLMGHGENSVFNIQQELEQLVQALKENGKAEQYTPSLHIFIGDIRYRDRLKHAFERFQPDVIFHAAAHKHVPLMELNSPEAITNNVLGTKNLVDLALQYKVQHFVMISTDKAVNPTNVMGASKRVAEMLVLQAAKKSGLSYVAVRFGNVLGSRGSVVPTFTRQILAGGPVTVTHPEIRRYFMTIPEAVQLVLQAAVIGHGGEVLMLNMGQPVKIVDLAKELIRLCGYEVNKDIEIVFTGLRPGEKLFEELFIEGEEYEPTEHEKLLVVKNASRIVPDNLTISVEDLCKAAAKNHTNLILFLLEQIVPGYKPKYLESHVLVDTVANNNLLAGTNGKITVRVKPGSV
ncbi:nucleoside-diphosphate sugar epimerase/dehydratase [Chlorogloeopsis sp. ULAP01]|uniref:polysaccharide biosynthesis protein n=1 Tax=Chlorogloeopsis sp. ULAP01 TaxID=3056483 RepID=UPI0025AB4B39|nr:nucleoside-diphosphate sugar epimerase/dehydratase [Chlorogloeopsis sp. ULAP01]MDM9385238.1 nucleoside-diphosphate sugar epimerase/dehydratase [Chlorogloeopsis sp. ULAP01]